MCFFKNTEFSRVGGHVYDIHCHIIPNVDDGSGSLSDSLAMAQTAVRAGVKGVVATPHSNITEMYENFWSEKFDEKIRYLNDEFKKRDISLTIYPGQEVYAHGNLADLLKEGKLITLNNSGYFLMEFDFRIHGTTAVDYVNAIVAEGYVPIIAHPERYGFVQESPGMLLKLRSAGALLQINSGSITGTMGIEAMRISKLILENRLADFVASDAHSQYSRTPDFRDAHELVCGYFGYDYAKLIFNDNPLNVINNTEIR